MKRIIPFYTLLISYLIFSSYLFSIKPPICSKDYGVFIGMDNSQIEKLYDYKKVVIDATYFSTAQIKALHKRGVTVYSYINLGSIENFRDYYNDFIDFTLSDYENWPEERWMNVAHPKWQHFFINSMAKSLAEKGIDGFFIDNVDIYYEYPTEEIYNGIKTTLLTLKETYPSMPLIMNGGYQFVQTALLEDLDLTTLIDGINQESVFTTIDFAHNRLTTRTEQDRTEHLDYVKQLFTKGLEIYIIEYTSSSSLTKKLEKYYDKIGYHYYISSTPKLT